MSVFIRDIKIEVGIHNDASVAGHPKAPRDMDEKKVESLVAAIADVIAQHTSWDSYVVAKYEKEVGTKVNS